MSNSNSIPEEQVWKWHMKFLFFDRKVGYMKDLWL